MDLLRSLSSNNSSRDSTEIVKKWTATTLTSDFHHGSSEEQVQELLRVLMVKKSVDQGLEVERDRWPFLDSGAGDGSGSHLEGQVGSDLIQGCHHTLVEEGLKDQSTVNIISIQTC